MWAGGRLLLLLLLLRGAVQPALAVDSSRDAFRQRVCMVGEAGGAADGSAGRAWWWTRFLLQELLDWATSLTASACAIAACAVLLRRTDPQPALRPRVSDFLAEALQGGKAWVNCLRRFQIVFPSTSFEPRPSRGVQTPSRSSLNETVSLDETAYLEADESSAASVDRHSLEEKSSVSGKVSAEYQAPLQEKASLEERVTGVTLPEAIARSSRVSSDIGTLEASEHPIRTSEAWLTLYGATAGGQQTACELTGPSDQLVATLSKYLDAVVAELRLTNSRLACVLPSLEHAVQQPKQSPVQTKARSTPTSPRSPVISSGSEAAQELVEEAVKVLASPPSDHGDSEAAVEVSAAQTSASWLQAQQQLAQERRCCERRVLALERRLREVLSELHVTRCQLAEALAAQDLRHRQVPPLSAGSESSVSLVSSTMDAMLSTASGGSDSASEARSSASASPGSTCTVVYRSKHQPAARSSVSSASLAASDTYTSVCTFPDTSGKAPPQDVKLSSPHPSRSSPAVLTPEMSLVDIADHQKDSDERKAKAPEQEHRRTLSEVSSEDSFVSSVSGSSSDAGTRKQAASPDSGGCTEASGNWLHAMHRLVQILRTSPQQPQGSERDLAALPPQPAEPGDASGKPSDAAIAGLEQQPGSSASSEESATEVKTSGKSLLSRMMTALLTPSTTPRASVVETSVPAEASTVDIGAAGPSKAETPRSEDKDATAVPASDQSTSEPPTEGRGLLSRMVYALLPGSTPAAASPAQSQSSVQDSRPASVAAIPTPADSKLSATAVISKVSCMDHQLSSVVILTSPSGTVKGSGGQTLPVDGEDRRTSLSYSWPKATDAQAPQEQTPPGESHAQAEAENVAVQMPARGSELDAPQEGSVAPGPVGQSDLEAPTEKPSRQVLVEETDTEQQLEKQFFKMDEVHPLVAESTPQPVLKDGDTQTDSHKERSQSPSKGTQAKPQQKSAGIQTQRKKPAVKPSIKDSGGQAKQLQESGGRALLNERSASRSPPRKRPQKLPEKREIHRPLKKSEERESPKDQKLQLQSKKDGGRGVPNKRAGLSPSKQRQDQTLPKSGKIPEPSKETGHEQQDKSEVQESLEDSKSQIATASKRPSTMETRNETLLPIHKIKAPTIAEEEEAEMLVENYDTQPVLDVRQDHMLPKDKSVQEAQQLPEPASAFNEVESFRTESASMVAESKSSCTQASMQWLRGLQRLTRQLQAEPKPSDTWAEQPLAGAAPSETLISLQELAKPQMSSLADVSACNDSLLSCMVSTMLTASSSSIVSEIKKWKHFGSYGGDKDSTKFASAAVESVDDANSAVGGASGDSQLIHEEKSLAEESVCVSISRHEEGSDQTSEMSAARSETPVPSEQGTDETSCSEELPQGNIRASVKRSRPSAPPKRRRPGSPLQKAEGETPPTKAVTRTLPQRESTRRPRRSTGTQTAKQKQASRILTKKRAVHKVIEERLDEEPEEESAAEEKEEGKERLAEQASAETDSIIETKRNSRFGLWTGSLRWLSHPLRAASLQGEGHKQRTSQPLAPDEKYQMNYLSGDSTSQDSLKRKIPEQGAGASKKSLLSSLVNAMVSDSSVPNIPLPPARSPSECRSDKNLPTVFLCKMAEGFDSGSITAESASEESSTSLQKKVPGSPSSIARSSRLQPLPEGSGDQLAQAEEAPSEHRLPTPTKSSTCSTHSLETGSGVAEPTRHRSWTHTYAAWLQERSQLMDQLQVGPPSLGPQLSQQLSHSHEEAELHTVRLSAHSLHSAATATFHTRDQTEEMEVSSSPSKTSTLKDWQPTLEDLEDQMQPADDGPQLYRPPSETASDVPSIANTYSESYEGDPMTLKRSSWTETYLSWLENQELLAKQLQEMRLRNDKTDINEIKEPRGHHSPKITKKLQVPQTTALSASKASLLSGVVSALMAAASSSGASASACSSTAAAAAAPPNYASSTSIPSSAAAPATYTLPSTATSRSATLVSSASNIRTPSASAASPDITLAYSVSSATLASRTDSCNTSIYATSPNITPMPPSYSTCAASETDTFPSSVSSAYSRASSISAASPIRKFSSTTSKATKTSVRTPKGSCSRSRRTASPTIKSTPSASNITTISAPRSKRSYSASSRAASPATKFASSVSKATFTSASSAKGSYASSNRSASPSKKFGPSPPHKKDSFLPSTRSPSPTKKFGPSPPNKKDSFPPSSRSPSPTKKFGPPPPDKKDSFPPSSRSASPTFKFGPSVSYATTASAYSEQNSYSPSTISTSPTINSIPSVSNITTTFAPNTIDSCVPCSEAASPTTKFGTSASNAMTASSHSASGGSLLSSVVNAMMDSISTASRISVLSGVVNAMMDTTSVSSTNKSVPSTSNVTTISATSAKGSLSASSGPASPTIKLGSSVSNTTTDSDYNPKESYSPRNRSASPTIKSTPSASDVTNISASSAKRSYSASSGAASRNIKFGSSVSNATTASAYSQKDSYSPSNRSASPTIKSIPSASNVTTISASSAKHSYGANSGPASPTIKCGSSVSNATTASAYSPKDSYSPSNTSASPTIKSIPSTSNVTTISASSAKHSYGATSGPASPTIKFGSSVSNATTASVYSQKDSYSPSSRSDSLTTKSIPSASNVTTISATRAQGTYGDSSGTASPNIKIGTSVSNATTASADSPKDSYSPSISSASPTTKSIPSASNTTKICANNAKCSYAPSSRTSPPIILFTPMASNESTISDSSGKDLCGPSSRTTSPTMKSTSSNATVSFGFGRMGTDSPSGNSIITASSNSSPVTTHTPTTDTSPTKTFGASASGETLASGATRTCTTIARVIPHPIAILPSGPSTRTGSNASPTTTFLPFGSSETASCAPSNATTSPTVVSINSASSADINSTANVTSPIITFPSPASSGSSTASSGSPTILYDSNQVKSTAVDRLEGASETCGPLAVTCVMNHAISYTASGDSARSTAKDEEKEQEEEGRLVVSMAPAPPTAEAPAASEPQPQTEAVAVAVAGAGAGPEVVAGGLLALVLDLLPKGPGP